MAATLRDLAERFGCELHGAGDTVVTRVATLAGAGPGAITFFVNPLYRKQLQATRAAAVILDEASREDCPVASLVCAQPYAAYARIAAFLHPDPPPEPGVHASAVVAPDAEVPSSAQLAAHVVIGRGCRLGESVVVGPGSVLGAGVTIGAHTRLVANVTVLDRVRVGERCIIHTGAVLGTDGFGFAPDRGQWVKVPQLGSVVIGNDVEIGANTTVDRGTIEDTRIGDGVKLDNLIHIGHNVQIGAHTIMAGTCGVAGSAKIGERCMIGGGAAILNHLEICDDVMILVRSLVTRSIRKPGVYSSVLPADEATRWRRNASRFKSLDAWVERVRAVERTLEALVNKLDNKKE